MASTLKHIVRISNSNLIRTPDGLIAKMDKDPEVKWIGKNKIRVNMSKSKANY